MSQKSQRLLRYVVDRNPCYLLSAVLLLVGCKLVSKANEAYTPDVRHLLVLLATVNVYELALIGLGLHFLRRPIFRRDGRIVLVLQGLFLADITFLNGDLSTANVRLGWGVNALLILLGAMKIWLVLRGLGVLNCKRVMGVVLAPVAMILIVPAAFKEISNQHAGQLSPWIVYGAWWVAGLLPVLAGAMWTAGGIPRTAARED